MRPNRTAAMAALLATCGTVAQAAPVVYFGQLSGAAESPPVATPATGVALVTLDATAQTLAIAVSFSGLSGPDSAAHIHCCLATPGGSGNVGVATTVPAFPGFPLGVNAGSYSHSLDLTDASSYNPSFVTASGGLPQAEAALIAGIQTNEVYLNIHTTTHPGGEIRGFLPQDTIFASAF